MSAGNKQVRLTPEEINLITAIRDSKAGIYLVKKFILEGAKKREENLRSEYKNIENSIKPLIWDNINALCYLIEKLEVRKEKSKEGLECDGEEIRIIAKRG